MLLLHLPPNLPAAAARNAVPVRVELDLKQQPRPEILPVLALLQRWCGPQAPLFMQLTRTQLRELAAAAGAEPIFVENGRAGVWSHSALLTEPTNATAAAGKTDAKTAAVPARRAGETPMTVDGSEHYLAITLPSREHPRHDEARELLRDAGFSLEPATRKWWLRDRHKTLTFLATHRDRLEKAFGAEFTQGFVSRTAHLRAAAITAEVTAAGEGFEVSLGLKAEAAAEPALRAAISSDRAYAEHGGQVILLNPGQVRTLAAAQRKLVGDPNAPLGARRVERLPAARAAEVSELLEEISPGYEAPETWRKRGSALRDLTRLEAAPVPAALDRQLRPYQRLGVAWLWHLRAHGLGGILADEMGLGKTAQALALLSAAAARGGGTALVVCPASLLENWRRESARFAPELNVFVHHGTNRLGSPADFAGLHLVITSYGTLARDRALFTGFTFAIVVADEAQHIKNRRSQNAAALRALRAEARFLLTGTPIENSLDDLRSLFAFLLPGYLPPVPADVSGEEKAWHNERLRAQAAPYILRRTKRAVAPELPARIEQVVWCELSADQAAAYRELQERGERELIDLEAGGANEGRLKLAALTQLLRLRQLCCDPRLLKTAAESGPPSAKLDAFQELLAQAVDDGHRLLVFSQFTSLLRLLREDLTAQGIETCYLDGTMAPRARQAEVDRFQADAAVPVFLLSLKAGGTGLNLTGADTVVHYDPWWNPAAEAQATDRAHRIGQTRVVTSYKLIAAGTVEEKVLALQDEKRALLADVFEASDALAAKLSLADLRTLLQ
ncbi:MAG: DEAD/DEAH box helicase [Opitutaceae bacterium]